MDFKVLRALVAAYIDDDCSTNDYTGDLLRLRDTLRDLADKVNDTYMNTPRLERYTCSECRTPFSIVETPCQ
jgi:hypothetical protein